MQYYNNQKLQVITTSKKCHLTLYFYSEYHGSKKTNKSKIINLKDKNTFITFHENEHGYDQHLKMLEKHGLIRSYDINRKNNLFLSPINKKPLIIKNSNIYDLNKHQKVFQYLNVCYIFQKNVIYKYYSSMKNIFGLDFNYMPETYNFPEDKAIIHKKFQNYKLNTNDLWLVKPPDKFCGDGIDILDSLKSIKLKKKFIITQYIKNIHLIKGKKYDLRLYVLISGLKPLRIYFYNEGLVRIATEKFTLNISNIKNKFVHLTNVYINKLNKNYIFPSNSIDEESNIWNIFMYEKYLKKNNIEWNNIREKIKDIIIKSIISIYKKLVKENERAEVNDQSFYEIFGYDILIKDDFLPKLIEINCVPSMIYTNTLDKKIKSNLFADTLNLIGISPFSRKTGDLIDKKFPIKNEINDNIENALCELERPRGDYELIFPTKETIKQYNKYFKNNTKENKIFWKKLVSE